MRRFKEAAERIPDPETTEDKALVAAAVRGASTKAPPPQKVDYSKLSDADFDTAVQQRHGFRPLGR
jgi:hypothetical protein